MEAVASFKALAASLHGQSISYIWRGYGSAIFIEFGDLTPKAERGISSTHTEGAVSLGVEWSWRIEDETDILCGSWSDEGIWEKAIDQLRDAQVSGLTLFGRLPEVELVTDGGVRFLSFSTTEGQPQWHLVDRRTVPPRWFTVRAGQLHLGDGSEPAF